MTIKKTKMKKMMRKRRTIKRKMIKRKAIKTAIKMMKRPMGIIPVAAV